MKYILLIICTAYLPFYGNSQRLHADLYAGVANYQGDLQGKRFTFDKAGISAGLGASYDLTNKFILRVAGSFARIQGDDKNNTKAKGVDLRNLNFKSNIFEGHLALEYNLLDLSEHSFTPYVFGGGAIYHFDPYTTNTSGKEVHLQPLGTEGQGLPQYPEKSLYKLTQFAIPFGGGLKLAMTDNLQLGLEFGFRKLFTDYLDDVSTTYADSSLLAQARGPQAAELAFRGDEIQGGMAYPGAGNQRGNPKMKDWYYMTGIRISYLLGSGRAGSGRKSKTGCPANVY